MPHILRRIVTLAIKVDRTQVILAMLCALGSAVATLIVPRLFGEAVNHIAAMLRAVNEARLHSAAQGAALESASIWTLALSAGLIVLASVVQGVLTGLAGYQSEAASQRVAYVLRLDYFRHLQRLPFSFHDRIHSGELITRGMIDLEGTRLFIQNGMMQSVTLVLLLVVATTMMFLADPVLALMALTFVPLSIVTLARVGYLLRIAWMRVQQLMSRLTLVMEESLQGMRIVRAFAAGPHEMARFDSAALEALQEAYKRIILRMQAMRSTTLAFYASMALVLWYGGHKVASGAMPPGRLTEFVLYLNILQAPIRQVIMMVMSAARATTCGGRLFEILDTPPGITDRPDAKPLEITEGVLRFEHVDFAYDPGKPVIEDINFTLKIGQTLGIVGPPGAGKSTIAQLIPRFYEITGGRITIDGQDIREVQLASLRSHVGLVQQEAFIFDATVTNNVAYADPYAEDDRIVGAAKTAQLHEYIAHLPAAYGTRVGERGVALSGGQRQRLSIARGVVPGPGIMIFDDSTAAIDAVTEKRVRDALAEATRAKATIIIAHRLSSLMHADEILVLDEGRIVERGTHAELLALGGEYADLFELQSKTAQGLSTAGARIRRKSTEAAE